MASRRTRIKGIANIPQRRKNNLCEEKGIEQDNLKTEEIEAENIKSSLLEADIKIEKPLFNTSETIKEPDCKDLQEQVLNNLSDNVKNHNTSDEIKCQTLTQEVKTETKDVPLVVQQPKPPIKRRTFLKPLVSVSAINRKPKSTVEKEISELTAESSIPGGKINTEEKLVEQASSEKDLKEKQVLKSVFNAGKEVTLNEVHLMAQTKIQEQEVTSDNRVKKILPQTSNAPTSDTEYPPPPPSPSKINRSRIKAIPRLGYRKTSFSASESEDESKRNHNRHRNDSVCSTASGVAESIADCMSPQRPRDFSNMVQKKCNRTEQSRKLAEARREFQRRFGGSKPDRQRLTMIDLIFYNPTSNPMVNEEKSKPDEEIVVEDAVTNQIAAESEKVDDPQPENAEEPGKSDEENEMPVPQIKIGPSGEMILDEKSLVIENKDVKKQREELSKTKLVDGDLDTGYGVYKRQKRAKDWTHNETLRFYKALNTIGTDFTLMCELFPRRTRRELKHKFKKEERINRTLIDKAVMEPCSFNYTELKHAVDMEEKELEELRKIKDDEHRQKKEKIEERQSKKRKAMEKAETEPTAENPPAPKPPKIRKIRKPRQKKLTIESVLEDSDADESDIATQSESEGEEEVVAPLKPTRSGRIPKVTKKYDTSEETSIETLMKKNQIPNTNSNDIEPGSIMIMTEAGPNGEPVHKIYMVTADKNATPLQLNSELISKAIQFKKGISAQNILTISETVTDDEGEKVPVPEENNVTIPADENVVTLRGNGACNGQDVEEHKVMVPADEDLANATTESHVA